MLVAVSTLSIALSVASIALTVVDYRKATKEAQKRCEADRRQEMAQRILNAETLKREYDAATGQFQS